MKWLQKESVRYALLLVILLAIATVAVVGTLNYLQGLIPQTSDFNIVTVIIWSLTLGFMLIAGAFGLWATTFAAHAESLRRLSSLVDAMTYIRDGVIALDRQGRVIGMNPAAVGIFGEAARDQLFTSLVKTLTERQLHTLMHSDLPIEAEAELTFNGTSQTLRLRAQPSQGMTLLLISDVTALVRSRERTHRTAYVQLVGHMANGVANDFNDLLCGIAGHAAILSRHGKAKLDVPLCAAAIQECANRGILLARQLMQLSGTDPQEAVATAYATRHINSGIDLLTSALPASWTIIRHTDTLIKPVNIPPIQLEHLIQSLGLAAAEFAPPRQVLEIRIDDPSAFPPPSSAKPASGILTIHAGNLADVNPDTLIAQDMATTGVITSVISALIHQAGGTFQQFRTPEGVPVYRIWLPEADPSTLANEASNALVLGLEAYAANWTILIDANLHDAVAVADYLRHADISTCIANGITRLLGTIERNDSLDAIAISPKTLGDDPASMLKAIARLAPQTGIVLQQNDMTSPIPNVVYVPDPVVPSQLLHALIEARSRIRSQPQAVERKAG